MDNRLTLENLLEHLPKPKPKKTFIIQIVDLLDLFRKLRAAGFKWRRLRGRSGKLPIYFVYPVGSPFESTRLFVDQLNAGTPGQLLMIDDLKLEFQRPEIKFEPSVFDGSNLEIGMRFGYSFGLAADEEKGESPTSRGKSE